MYGLNKYFFLFLNWIYVAIEVTEFRIIPSDKSSTRLARKNNLKW